VTDEAEKAGESDETIEDRVDTLEDRLDSVTLTDLVADENIKARLSELDQDVTVSDLEARTAALQEQQAQIQRDISTLAEQTREQGDDIPHIDSVRYLYLSLQDIEQYMAEVSQQLDELKRNLDEPPEEGGE
jgi:DNA-binding transcriptional MerR regulator